MICESLAAARGGSWQYRFDLARRAVGLLDQIAQGLGWQSTLQRAHAGCKPLADTLASMELEGEIKRCVGFARRSWRAFVAGGR